VVLKKYGVLFRSKSFRDKRKEARRGIKGRRYVAPNGLSL